LRLPIKATSLSRTTSSAGKARYSTQIILYSAIIDHHSSLKRRSRNHLSKTSRIKLEKLKSTKRGTAKKKLLALSCGVDLNARLTDLMEE